MRVDCLDFQISFYFSPSVYTAFAFVPAFPPCRLLFRVIYCPKMAATFLNPADTAALAPLASSLYLDTMVASATLPSPTSSPYIYTLNALAALPSLAFS